MSGEDQADRGPATAASAHTADLSTSFPLGMLDAHTPPYFPSTADAPTTGKPHLDGRSTAVYHPKASLSGGKEGLGGTAMITFGSSTTNTTTPSHPTTSAEFGGQFSSSVASATTLGGSPSPGMPFFVPSESPPPEEESLLIGGEANATVGTYGPTSSSLFLPQPPPSSPPYPYPLARRGAAPPGMAALTTVSLKGSVYSPRWGLAAATLGSRIFLYGGYLWQNGIEGFFNDLYVIEPDKFSCVRPPVQPAPAARFGHSLVADEQSNQLWMYGGRDASTTFSDFWAFDVSTCRWQLYDRYDPNSSKKDTTTTTPVEGEEKTKSSAEGQQSGAEGVEPLTPGQRSWHGAVAYRGGLYVIGGWTPRSQFHRDLWRFDFRTRIWERILMRDSSNPSCCVYESSFAERACHNVAIWQDELYLMGGISSNRKCPDLVKFTFATGEWNFVHTVGPSPLGRTSAAAVVMGDRWIFHGGLQEYPQRLSSPFSDVIEYHFPSCSWNYRSLLISDSATPAICRYGHAAVPIPHSSGFLLLGGADKFAQAVSSSTLRLEFLSVLQEECPMLQEQLQQLHGRVATLMASEHNTKTQLSVVSETARAEIQDLKDRQHQLHMNLDALSANASALSSQNKMLQDSVDALHAQLASLRVTVSQFEHCIPMLRNVGAAFAQFGMSQIPVAVGMTGGSEMPFLPSGPQTLGAPPPGAFHHHGAVVNEGMTTAAGGARLPRTS